MLDLSMLATIKGEVCVRCRCEHDAKRFTSEMKMQYPKRCMNWADGETNWDRCERRGYIDYFPYFDKLESSGWGMCWDDDDYTETHGCVIVEFSDIPDMLNVDLGDIEASEMSIRDLF